MNPLPLYRLLSAALLLVALTGWAAGSADDELKRRRTELQGIRDQIRDYETKIEEQKQNEREALDLLDTYDRKATLLRKLISRYRADERLLQKKIEETRTTIDRLEGQLAYLKAHYAKYVTAVYKAGRIHDAELLLMSSSVNQFLIRTEYLKRFTAQRQRDAQAIVSKREQIEQIQAELQQQLTEERLVIAEKAAEQDRLLTLAADRRTVISQIRKDRKLLQKEMDRKIKAAKDLEEMIAKLIEEDRLRREREAEEVRKGKLPQPPPVAGTFEARRGKLRWPVSEGMVVAKFGNQRHPTLRTITQNTGIDIAVTSGSPVSTVADGEIATIWWLPSYGNLIIVNHYNGYRTVYAHLAEILVTEGQKVKEGEVIANSGESLDGPRLHFEVWKEREKQNPEQWLSRR